MILATEEKNLQLAVALRFHHSKTAAPTIPTAEHGLHHSLLEVEVSPENSCSSGV
jgi:hypothetical protein